MKAAPKILLALTGVAALSLAHPASVQAVPTTYQYTGNPFTVATAPYSTSDFVTGMVTLAGPLAPNMLLTSVLPIAFTFSDGVQTLTNVNVDFFSMQFATGPTGAITAWSVDVRVGMDVEIATGDTVGNVVDVGFLNSDLGIAGFNFGRPGTWSTKAIVADTGSTLSLMTLTLMALGLVARRFQRAAG